MTRSERSCRAWRSAWQKMRTRAILFLLAAARRRCEEEMVVVGDGLMAAAKTRRGGPVVVAAAAIFGLPLRIRFGVVEIPRGSKVKYELDKSSGLIKVDCVLYSSVVYPHNSGFSPRTLCEDSGPMDVLILMQISLDVARKMIKIIAVCADDPEFCHYKDITDLPPHRLQEIRRFFEDYKKNENKEVAVNEFLPTKYAINTIKYSMDLYGSYIIESLRK
nr:unnamed protein product [Digitaria exilis]